jgi:PTS system nitrogen regulatory IIA component
MKLSSLINPDLVLVQKSCKTKHDLLDELMKGIFRTDRRLSVTEDQVRKAILEREYLGGTVFPTGLATPHTRLEHFEDLLIAVGIPLNPIPATETEDSIRMMVMLLTSQSSTSLYLNSLAAFAKISQDDVLFGTLCASSNANIFIQTLKNANVEVMKEMTIGAVMHPSPVVLGPENTVKDAADMFYKNHLGYAPILDSQNNFIGEIGVLDLFAIGIPDYAAKLGNLKFLRSFEPFEDLLKKEAVIKLKDIMRKPGIILEESSPVIEAVMKFIQSKRRYLPVEKDGKLTGVVGYMDILHKVLRA